MRVLAVGCGSSSLTFRPSETPADPSDAEARLAWDSAEGLGSRATVDLTTAE